MVKIDRTLRQKAWQEIKAFYVIAFYIWVVLTLLELHRSLVLGRNHIEAASQGFEIINALALSKVVLVGQKLRLGEFTHDWPLIYPTLLKSGIFAVVLASFKVLEAWAVGVYHGLSFSQSIQEIGGGTLRAIFAVTAIAFVALIPFFGVTELQKIMAEGTLRRAFFHRRRQPLILAGAPDDGRQRA